jgi:hypothetical protein
MSKSRSAERPGGLSAARRLRTNLDYIHELPDPPATFVAADIEYNDRETRKKLLAEGVLEVVSRSRQKEGSTEYRQNEYRVVRWAADRVAEMVGNRDTFCPCGHGGFCNRGEYFVCGFEGCDERFERDELDTGGST